MPAQMFSMEAQPEGGARFSLQYKHAERGGIQRLSCDLARGDLVQLVLFAEALSLNQSLAHPQDSQVEVNGLSLHYTAGRDLLSVTRQAGYSRQDCDLPLRAFLGEMPQMTDLCIAEAEASKHGRVLLALLAECTLPAPVAAQLTQDKADQILHQLREIALLVLAQEAAVKSSVLARKLRARKSLDEAQALVQQVIFALSEGVIPALPSDTEIPLPIGKVAT